MLLAADQTLSINANSDTCQNGVDVSVCHNGTANHHDDVESSSTVSRVRLVQFEKNTTDPLVGHSFLEHMTCLNNGKCVDDCFRCAARSFVCLQLNCYNYNFDVTSAYYQPQIHSSILIRATGRLKILIAINLPIKMFNFS